MKTFPFSGPKVARHICVAALILGAAACTDPAVTRGANTPAAAPVGRQVAPLAAPETVDSRAGTCFARATTPARIETVTEQIMVPEVRDAAGVVVSPVQFKTITRQNILEERREVEFETPCNHVLTPPFIGSLQRALLARGYYRGAISGRLDDRTLRAVERFQIDRGDVATRQITLRTAQNLGLVAIPRDAL